MLAAIGIIVALTFLSVAIYKGLNPILTGFLSGFIIMFTSNLPVQDTFSTAIGTCGTILGIVAPPILIGAMMGMIYNASGAMISFSHFLYAPVKKIKNRKVQVYTVVIVFLIIRFLIGLSGIDNNAIMVTMVALSISIFYEFDLPARYIPCIGIVASTMANLIPGTPVMINLMCEQFIAGFSRSGAMAFRMVLLIVFAIGVVLIMGIMMNKDIDKGVKFEQGPMEIPDFSNQKMPPWFFALIPVIVVFITYNYLSCDAWLSVTYGLITSLIFFGPYIQPKEGETKVEAILGQLDKGMFCIPLQIMLLMFPAQVMSLSSGLTTISDGLAVALPAAVALLLIAVVVMGFGGAMSASVIGTLAVTTFASMTPVGIGVVTVWAAAVFDTLPNNTGIIINANLCGVTMKEAYPPVFNTSVLLTGAIAIIATIAVACGMI